MPAKFVGILVLLMGVLTATKQVKIGSFKEVSEEFKIKKIKSNRE